MKLVNNYHSIMPVNNACALVSIVALVIAG